MIFYFKLSLNSNKTSGTSSGKFRAHFLHNGLELTNELKIINKI